MVSLIAADCDTKVFQAFLNTMAGYLPNGSEALTNKLLDSLQRVLNGQKLV